MVNSIKDIGLFLRSLVFSIIFLMSLVFFSLLSIIVRPLPERIHYPLVTAWARLNIWVLKVVCGVKYQVEGTEHLPQGTAIALVNHQSTWETMALTFILPPQVWVLKKELLRLPFFGWGATTLKAIAIDRRAGRNAVEQMIEQGRNRLKSGKWVVIFPEGTRVAPGEKRRFKLGGAILSAQTGYPVVPVAHNAGKAWPRQQFIKRPGLITVRIGPVIKPEGLEAAQINQQAEAWIRAQVEQLEAQD